MTSANIVLRCKMAKMDETTNDIIIINFDVIVKKNNHTLVSDEDRKILILGSTDNAGNSVNLVSGIIR